MIKCDVCEKKTLFPEVLGDANICKLCFLKIQGPIWKYRKFENLKQAEIAKKKAIDLAKKANYPEIICTGIEKYFEMNNSKMKQCSVCKEFSLTTISIGKNKLCKKCFAMIKNDDWDKKDFDTNNDVEISRNKILEIAKNNNFSESIINDINVHFDKKIKKGLFRIKNDSSGQILKVFDKYCILVTTDNFSMEEISKEYNKALKSEQSGGSLPDYVGEELLRGILRGGVVKAGVSLAKSAAVNAVVNEVLPTKNKFNVLKGSLTINYKDFDYVDCQNVGDNEIGFLRFRKSSNHESKSDDVIFFFEDDSYINEIYNYIQEQIRKEHNPKVENINKESIPDEILKYKNLLDMGAITKDEYEKKKKELLDL